MESIFMVVNRKNIDQAFALAHRAGEDDSYPAATRNLFREIAQQIWLSAGGARPTETAAPAAQEEDGLSRCSQCRKITPHDKMLPVLDHKTGTTIYCCSMECVVAGGN